MLLSNTLSQTSPQRRRVNLRHILDVCEVLHNELLFINLKNPGFLKKPGFFRKARVFSKSPGFFEKPGFFRKARVFQLI